MIRRDFIKGLPLLAGAHIAVSEDSRDESPEQAANDRQLWLDTLLKVINPVLKALSENRLKQLMPVEASPESQNRRKVTYLEALGRTMAGLAPWLELSEGSSSEKELKKKYTSLALSSIKNAVTPGSADFMNFTEEKQPLVDAAFLAHALLRAPKALWDGLDKQTQQHLVNALRSTRAIQPYESNWLLFSAMVEAALLKFSGDHDQSRIDYAINKHQEWYKGDGVYGDGPDFHFDYYNSYVIQPMMVDIARTVFEATGKMEGQSVLFVKRAKRYAEIQERMISPEGTFPPVGRSIAYRCGAFQLLAQMALHKQLPEPLKPAQVRCALTAVIRKTMLAPDTFDKNGWLTIGLAGHQPGVGEHYISTGSLYLCTTAFVPLGLPAEDEFWSAPAMDWTSKQAFGGRGFKIDKAMS
jgi:hypothetical protein